MQNYTYYTELVRPDWAPPAWLFGPVWTVLYILIAISFGYVFYKYKQGKLKQEAILPFALNLIFNVIFTPILFGLKNNVLASVDVLLVWGTLVWLIIAIKNKYRWVALMNIPYLVWVSFATVLQLTVTYLNL